MADPIADLLVKVSADISGMQEAFNTAESKLQAFGDSATAAGGSLMKLGAPLTGLGLLAATTAGDFEASMNILGVAAGGAGVSMEDLRSVALKAGSDVSLVGVSASDVAVAMTNFTKAGVSTGDMLGDMTGYLDGTAQMGGQLRAAIDLAAASELDLDAASRLVITTMATFGMSAEDASAAMDTYVRAADASVMSVQDIADAMENVGPTMAQFGFSVDDVSTALAILSTRGIMGAEAGTALKSMMVNLMRPTQDVTETLAAMNVSLYDSAGNMKPLPTIMAELERGMAGMTEEQRNNTIVTLAGSYGMKAMSTLLAEGTVGWNDMAGSIATASTMQESAAAQTKGFNAAMENLKSTIEGFLINVGTPLINDVLTPMIKKITDVTSALSQMDPKFLETAIVVAGVVTGLGALLLVVGQIAGALSSLAPIIGAIGAPLGIVGLAVAAFALAWEGNWFGIRDTLTAVWTETIQPTFEKIVQAAQDIIAFFQSGDWNKLFSDMFVLFGYDLGKRVAEIVAKVDEVLKAFQGIAEYLRTGDLNQLFSDLFNAFGWDIATKVTDTLRKVEEFVGGVKTFINDLIAYLKSGEVSDLWLLVTNASNVFGTKFGQVVADVAGWIQGTLIPRVKDVVDWFEINIPRAWDKVTTYWNGTLKPALEGVAGALGDIYAAARDIVEGDWSGAFKNLGIPQSVLESIQHVIKDVQDLNTTLGDVLSPGVEASKKVLGGLASFFSSTLLPALTAVNNFIGTYLTPIFRGVAEVVSGVLTVALTAMHGLWDKVILPKLEDVWTFVKVHFAPIFDTLATVFKVTLEPILRIVGGLFDKLGPALSPLTGYLTTIATWLGNVADKLKILKLPDWLTPGSPTPFETALLGILDALKKVAGGPWEWFTKFTDWLGGAGGGGGGVTISVVVSEGAVVVYGADPYAMGDAVGQAIARALNALIESESKYGPGAGWALP